MLPSAFSEETTPVAPQDFEQLIQESILSIKSGHPELAKKLLEKAALVNANDPRIWIWLSATTNDLTLRRAYLERAVVLDPSNPIAKRGILVLECMREDLTGPEPEDLPLTPVINEPAGILKTYTCPNCGEAVDYDEQDMVIVCKYCGFTRKLGQESIEDVDEQSTQVGSAQAPTQHWAASQTCLVCDHCGAIALVAPGQSAETCPHCASHNFAPSTMLMETIDPQVIGLIKIDPEQAAKNIKTWLSRSIFAPDDLAEKSSDMHLIPAYYPFWIFNGNLEIPWFCDVDMGKSGQPQWEPRAGSRTESFTDFIVPGWRKMPFTEMAGIAPFNMAELVDFFPEYLTTCMTLTYDQPMADASLIVRDKLSKKVRKEVPASAIAGRPMRNFKLGEGKWSSLESRLALLPIYVGNYIFKGQPYRLFVNGQTGKVSGKKPLDTLKATMLIAAGILVLAIIIIVASWLLGSING